MKMRSILLAAVAAVAFGVQAKVTLAPPFADNMVLQRGKPVAVWGKAVPGEEVTVAFAGQSVKAKADEKGVWMLHLAPMDASKENRVLAVKGMDDAVEVRNVLVGEVWFCSGQSNMKQSLWWNERPDYRDSWGAFFAQITRIPWFRFGKASNFKWSLTARDTMDFTWYEVSPSTLVQSDQGFSAVGFYYGLTLVHLLDVPVGMIDCHWDGSNIEPWLTPEGIASVPALADIDQQTKSLQSPAADVGAESRDGLIDEYNQTRIAAAAKARKVDLPARDALIGELDALGRKYHAGTWAEGKYCFSDYIQQLRDSKDEMTRRWAK